MHRQVQVGQGVAARCLRRGARSHQHQRLVRQQVGQTVRVLVEGYGRNEGTLSGRLDNNLTVEFAADPALLGSYATVHLTGARATVLLGEVEA